MSSAPDAFARTAAALSVTLRAHAHLLTESPSQFRNYMLDECGSDFRPLAELLLSVGLTIRAHGGDASSGTSWETRRAPLVHQLVSTRYLQPDVARWLVDAWGAALGQTTHPLVAPTPPADESPASLAAPLGRRASATAPAAVAPAAAALRGQTPRVPAPATTAASMPSWAGGPRSPRTGTRQATTTPPAATNSWFKRAGHPRWRSNAPPMSAARFAAMQRIEVLILSTMGMTGIGLFFAAAFALASRKEAAIVSRALPLSSDGTASAAAPPAAAPPAAALPAADASTAATRETPPSRVPEATVRPSPASLDTTPPSMAMLDVPYRSGAALIAAGLGGHYRVSQRVRTVSGSQSCAQVAKALGAGRVSEEVIEHVPGSFAFVLSSRGVSGTLSEDADFDAGPQNGMKDGVDWVFRLRGRFTSAGFVAESWTTTRAILRWGRTQTCLTVADLTGERIPS